LDGIKLFIKEFSFLIINNKVIFYLRPIIRFLIILRLWLIFPSFFYFINIKYRIIFFLCLIGLSVYSVLLSGWRSNSKYAILGGIRASAQSVSYEISLSIIIFRIIIFLKSYNITFFIKYSINLIIFIPLIICWFLSCVAECNRAPFDFAEGESELVSGFNVEYGRVDFALIFIREYGIIIIFSLITCFIFFSKNEIFFLIISLIFLCSILILRSVYPRFRYDKLIYLSWFKFLPISCIFLIIRLLICLIFL
jgi:NADH-ubiquinone oxidoreductase chain 1